MKRIVFLLLLLSSCIYGQGNKFTISGVVTDCKTKLPLINFPVKIVCSDGKAVETNTDVYGKYILELQNIQTPLSCVLVFYTEPNPISCIYTGVKTKFTIDDLSINNRIEDMCLVNMGKMEVIMFPDISFKHHTTKFASKNEKRKIDDVTRIMNDNPTFVIQICGYQNPSEVTKILGLSRAQKVYESLIKKGIDKNRVEIIDYVTNEAFNIVSFRILRKDYVSPNAIKIK